MSKKTLTREMVRIACIEKDWFTGGSNEQYEKMFKKVDEGSSVHEVALLIWICTEDVSQADIEAELIARLEPQNKKIMNEKLIEAAKEGRLDGVRKLLEYGADVHAEDDYALRHAAYRGHIKVVKLLLKHGANVHAEDDLALRVASANGHTEIVKLLLKNGADVHTYDDYAFQMAAYYGHIEIVKMLLEHGANVHARYNSALRWAAQKGHTEIVELLEGYC